MKKIRHHYIYVETNFKPSRTYGGGTYVLAIHKVEGVGKTRRVGDVTACTRSHKGPEHEVWTLIQKDLPPALLKKIHKVKMPSSSGPQHYIPWGLKDTFGVLIHSVG